MSKSKTIHVQGTVITILRNESSDFVSLTDIARYKDVERTDTIIQNWLRNRNTNRIIGFLGTIVQS